MIPAIDIITQPDAEPIGGRCYRLRGPWECVIRFRSSVYKFFLPDGFVWDGASVPRFAWTLTGMTPDGLWRAAACLHDFLYDYAGKVPEGSCYIRNPYGKFDLYTQRWTREQADDIFDLVCRLCHEEPRHRRLAKGIIRTFGCLFWGRKGPTLPKVG